MTNAAISYSDTRDISLEAIRKLYVASHYIRLPSTWTGRKSVRRLGGMALSASG